MYPYVKDIKGQAEKFKQRHKRGKHIENRAQERVGKLQTRTT